MKIGLIGAGRWGRNAARAMAKAGVLAWVSDPDTDAAVALASEHGVPVRPPYDFTGCDGCWVASPIETHELLVRELIVAHKHVLCEKPLARTKAQAEMLADEAKRRGLVLMCDFTWEAHAGVLQLLASDGIRQFHAARHAQDERGFDPLEDLLPHDVALARLAFDQQVRRVSVVNGAEDEEDCVIVALDIGDRDRGCGASTSYSYSRSEKVRRVTVTTEIGNDVAVYRNDGENLPGAPEPLAVILDTFLDAIRTGQPPTIGSADEFIHVAAVIEAAKKSRASGGGWVDVV